MNYLGELDTKHPKKHLPALETEGAIRSFYNSVSFCNRCGACNQSCPTYRLTQEEPFSPRGRNQAVRLVLERKINVQQNRVLLEKIAYSCTVCGLCTRACAGQIPTAQHVLELRRLLGNKALPFTLQKLLKLRQLFPSFFGNLMKLSAQLRRYGFLKLIRFSGLANLLNCAWLHRADKLLPPYQAEAYAQLKALKHLKNEKINLIYLPSFEADYWMPSLQLAVLKSLPPSKRPVCWHDTPSGLFEYVYGDLRAARKQVKELINRHHQTGSGNLPLVTDSIDVYNFLKQAHLLFISPHVKNKARAFADCVCFVTDFRTRSPQGTALKEPLWLDRTALFSCEEEPFQKIEKYLCKNTENLIQFTYNATGGAFGYSFVIQGLNKTLQNQSVLQICQAQVQTLITLSGWAQLEWKYAFKQKGKSITVLHAAEL